MKLKNKSMGQVLKLIIGLPIFLLFALFFTIGMFQLGEVFIIDNLHNYTVSIMQDNNISTTWINTANVLRTDFDTHEPPFELFFALVLVIAFGVSIFVAMKSKALPFLSFTGSLVIGMLIMLLLMIFVDQFATWYLEEFFYRVFEEVDNVLLDWYFDNLSLISAIWMGLLLFLNQIEIDFKGIFSRNQNGGIVEE